MIYEEINKRTWNGTKKYLLSLLNKSSYWIFRGQSNPEWELKTTIERELHYGETENISIEKSLINEFKRAAHNYLENKQIPVNNLEWMALMQHYGAPTRLIDFTKSPYIAAYFAFENINQNSKYVTIWAIEYDELRRLSKQIYVEENINEIMNNNNYLAYPIEPKRMNERFERQQGTFLISGNISQSLETNMISMGLNKDKGIMKKINIPTGERENVLQDLSLMNINSSTLFPGLDGYARYIKKMPEIIYKKEFIEYKKKYMPNV